MTNQNLNYRLTEANLALANVEKEPYILESMARYGYDKDRLKEGRKFYSAAFEFFQDQELKKYHKAQAYDAFQEVLQESKKKYSLYRGVGRIALAGDVALMNSLGFGQPLKQNLSGLLERARVFYRNALQNPSIMSALGKFNVSAEDLEEADKLIDEVENASLLFKRKKADVQKATQLRDEAFKVLGSWMKDFWRIAKLALAERPRLYESLRMNKQEKP